MAFTPKMSASKISGMMGGAGGYPGEPYDPNERIYNDPMQGLSRVPEVPPLTTAEPMPSPGQQTPGAPTEKVLQPGNRRSIKDYLDQIRAMQAGGQNVYPTFTNIQGGDLDVTQGQLGGQDVQSYVTPEWIQGPEGAKGGLTMGPAHPQMRAREAMGVASNTGATTVFDAGWADQKAISMLPEIENALRERQAKTGQAYTQEDFNMAANRVRMQMHELQAREVMQKLKQFKDFTGESVAEAFKSGDFSKLKKVQKGLNPAKLQQEIYNNFLMGKYTEGLENPDTGEPFTAEEFARYHTERILRMLNEMLQQEGKVGAPTPGAGVKAPEKSKEKSTESKPSRAQLEKEYAQLYLKHGPQQALAMMKEKYPNL